MFVGRERELAALEAALPRTAPAHGVLCLLVGEPGIGKTRLATEVIQRAREQGIRSSWGRCWEGGGAPAFWPWREALEGLGIEFPDPKQIAATNPEEARFALFREVATALERESMRQPIVIVLEDLHAADRSTLVLLEFVATQARALPLMMIGTYRDLEVSLRSDAADTIARTSRSAQVFQLARLRPAEVTALVRDAIEDADDRLAASVYETTHGNPLFVGEIVRDVRARGARSATVPLGVREVIRQRLALVSEETRRVLDVSAVLGVEFGAADVERIVPGARVVLDEAARVGLVVAHGNRVRFSHALYREALYHDLPRPLREQLHRDAAGALGGAGAPLAETAHHLLESGSDASEDAVDHAVRAAVLALDVFAFEDAIALLERARDAIPRGPSELRLRARVSIALGEARIRSGDAGGRELCIEAASSARKLGDRSLLARAGLAYGSVLVMGAVDPILVGLLEEALGDPNENDPGLRARTMARLAAARQPSHPSERPRDIALALQSIEMGLGLPERRDRLDVLQSACGALYGAADPAVRLPIAREAERLAEELGDITRLLQARVRLAMDHLELADFASYERLASAYEELAARIGRAAAPWRVPLMRSMLALTHDRFGESERWQEESRRIESEHPRARRAQAFHRIGFLRASERHAELRASIPELRGLWLQMPYGHVLAEPFVASSLARIGADEEVAAILAKLPKDAFDEEINGAPLAEAVWLAGNAVQAKHVLGVIGREPGRWQSYWLDSEIAEAPRARSIGYLSAIAGDWKECDRAFAYALESVESVGKRSMAARMRFELGDLLVRQGREPERALALISEARALASDVGLSELVQLIDRRHPDRRAAPPSRRVLESRPQSFSMLLEGEYYAIATIRGTLRFKATRGMRYLAALIAQPGVEIHALELAGAGDHADRGDAGELLDPHAFASYRARLEALRDAVEDAEALGDPDRAARLRGEMEAIAGEIRKATGRSGRARRGESAVDRARSAVQRRIKDALDRIAEQDAELGRWLRGAVRTGNYCSFRPAG